MVHALVIAHGLLCAHGMVADLRPDRVTNICARHIQVYCLTGDHRVHAGRLKLLKPLADFRAADRAVREVIRRGRFGSGLSRRSSSATTSIRSRTSRKP